MGIMKRIGDALALRMSDPVTVSSDPAPVTPPARETVLWTRPDIAPTVGVVFTAVSIIATAIEQLSFDLQRNDATIAATRFVRNPDPDLTSRSDWLHELTTSLALHGNAYLRTYRNAQGHADVARVLNPATVHPWIDDRTGRKRFAIGNRDDYTTRDVMHLRLLKPPGRLFGLGPIQAAQPELAGHRDLTEAGTGWIRNAGVPSGLLSTEQNLTPDQRAQLLADWNNVPAGRTRLMSNGIEYKNITISPRDAQFLETRRFSKTEILDLFGIPASLSLGIDKGDSQTYANISQDWLGFVRFRLMRYVREIEEAMTALVPHGQQVRANLEALLRSDALTRMQIHKTAIDAKIYSPEYARTIEHLPADAAGPQEIPA